MTRNTPGRARDLAELDPAATGVQSTSFSLPLAKEQPEGPLLPRRAFADAFAE